MKKDTKTIDFMLHGINKQYSFKNPIEWTHGALIAEADGYNMYYGEINKDIVFVDKTKKATPKTQP